MAETPVPAPSAPTSPSAGLTDLPDDVLALIVALGLTEAHHVASFAAASRRCAAVCRAAPLRLAVAARASSPSEEQAEARAKLAALTAGWPGIAELDLRGTRLEDADVERALRVLPCLELLQLSGCKKVTPAAAAALAAAPPPQLRTLTLQRCFQLTGAALGDVLAAAAAPPSRLACAALSHLCLESWPPAAPPPAGGLRLLALHNCSKLGSAALAAVAAACPHLEVLMLGGAGFALEDMAAAAEQVGGDEAAAGPLPAADAAHLHAAALAAVLEEAPHLGGFCGYVAAVAAQLAALAAALPRLHALELTFGLPGLAPALRRMAAAEPLLLAGRSEPLEVWDLATSASVEAALRWRRAVRSRCRAGVAPSAITPADADALLCAAVGCSSAARQTPLHAAVEEGGPPLLRSLLGLGAAVDVRDRSGATPLFAACEAGHLRSAECLLAAGASATLKNSAGEAPLYIAALKGHERVVDLLLAHCRQRGISWQAHADGDSWTPLMAAVVASRTSIVLKLLHAAGQEAAGLIQAVNRYGQNSLHIAARKGSAGLLTALVDAGGSASLLRADADGRTAAEVARAMRNGGAMRVLGDASSVARQEQQRQRGTLPTAERPRANEHRQQHPAQRWVGRRLGQRKGGAGGGGGGGGGGGAAPH